MTSSVIHDGDPNIAQRDASDPTASVWVSASAGSGKTKVLSDRVLRLMLSGTSPQRILCLTFTKAASAEMANRINARLGGWVTMEDCDLQEDLNNLTGTVPDDDQTRRARRLFAHVLDTPGGMKIQTIHAFCHSLLRCFPLEARLAPHFDIMDERTAAETMADAREEVLARARDGCDANLTDALSVITSQVGERTFGEIMHALVLERGRFKRMLARHGGAQQMCDAVFAALAVVQGQDEADILHAGMIARAFDREGLQLALQALACGSKTDQERSLILARFLEKKTIEDRLAMFDDYHNMFFTRAGKLRARLMTAKAAANDPAGLEALEREATRLAEIDVVIKNTLIARATSALIILGQQVLHLYTRKKALRARLDYDDLILTSLELLGQQNGIAQWVLFKLDGGIDHILIDEAQDTNPEQWRIVQILAEEFFSGMGQHDEHSRTIFAVGDIKQSIYSFQRADPDCFSEMRAYFRQRARQAQSPWREVPMNVSFRSTDAVLAMVDHVFARPTARYGVGSDTADISHRPFRVGQAGRVELWPVVRPQERKKEMPWTAPTRIVRLEDPEIRLARVIAGHIHRAINDGDILPSRDRPICAGDFMILVRRRTAFVDEVVKALKERDVPVAGVDRMRITDQLVVMDLMAFGRFLLMPEDDLTLAELLKSPLIGLNEDQLFELAHHRPDKLWHALRDQSATKPVFATAYAFLSEWLGKCDYERPFELFAAMLGGGGGDARGGRARLIGRLGREANDPIDEFLNLAMAYEAEHAPTLQGFLHWLLAGNAEIKRDLEQGGRGEVRIMTVHGAKGLQAPIVFLPDSMQVPTQSPDLFWQEDQNVMFWLPRRACETDQIRRLRESIAARRDAEYNRLLYVALTRAEDRLYICGWQGRRMPPEHCWYALCARAMEGFAQPETFDFRDFSRSGWAGSGWVWETGQTALAEAGQIKKPDQLPSILPHHLIRDIAPEESALSKPLTPGRLVEDDLVVQSPLGGDQGQNFKRGLLIHKLLEVLPSLPVKQWQHAAERFLMQPIHRLAPDQQGEIARETLSILHHQEFSPVFGPGSKAEVPLVGVVEGHVVSAQIDRLVVQDDQVMIVDYKTSRPPPRDASGTPKAYRRQMAIYQAALQQMYPGRAIRCYILWTNGPWMVELPKDVLHM